MNTRSPGRPQQQNRPYEPYIYRSRGCKAAEIIPAMTEAGEIIDKDLLYRNRRGCSSFRFKSQRTS